MKIILIIIWAYILIAYSTGISMKSDREINNLQGPVHTVRSQTVIIKGADGLPADKRDSISVLTTYDRDGRNTERTFYNDSNSIVSKTVLSYDGKGRRTEAVRSDGKALTTGRTIYTYAPDGNRIERRVYGGDDALVEKTVTMREVKANREEVTLFRPENQLVRKTLSTYDEQGREIEAIICHGIDESESVAVSLSNKNGEASAVFLDKESALSSVCGPDSQYVGRVLINYDDKERSMKIVIYKGDGSLEARKVSINDKAGNAIEVVDYSADGSLVDKVTYNREYDLHGNWIKATKEKLDARSGKLLLVEVEHREITYF